MTNPITKDKAVAKTDWVALFKLWWWIGALSVPFAGVLMYFLGPDEDFTFVENLMILQSIALTLLVLKPRDLNPWGKA